MRQVAPMDKEYEKQFEELYRAYYDDLCRYAAALLKGYSSKESYIFGRSEEVVQETFSIAWAKRSALFSSPSPIGWLYKALHHKVQESIREEQKWTKQILRFSEYADNSSKVDFRLRTELLDSIPGDDYMILKRLYLDGITYRELSMEMGIKQSALAMRVKRAKERLRKKFEEH